MKIGGLAAIVGLSPKAGVALDLALAADAGTPLHVKIADTDGNLTLVLQAMLREKGYFRKFGLDAEILNVSDGSKIIGALLNGDVDVCMISGFSSLLPAIERGASLKILCGAGTLVAQCLYSKRPDIWTLKDLVGKNIGVGAIGALLHEITVAMLRKHGIDDRKVNFVNIGSSTDIFRAVVAGTVDAGPSQIDNYLRAGGFGVHALTDGKAWEQIPDYTWQAGYASDRAIAGKRDALVRTLAAFGALYRFLTGPHSYESYSHARAMMHQNDPADAKFFWDFVQKYKGFAYNLTLSPEQIDYVQDLNVSLGVQKKKLPINQVADMSIAKDALRLMS